MKHSEIRQIKPKANKARVSRRVTVPNAGTMILGLDTEYISREGQENEPLSWQLHDGVHGHFMPIPAGEKLRLTDLVRTLTILRHDMAPQARHVCLLAWYAQAEMSVIEDNLGARVLHQGGTNYGMRIEVVVTSRNRFWVTIYDLQALLGGSLAKAAPLVGLEKLDWEHGATTRESLKDGEFQRYAIRDAEICQRLGAALHREFTTAWGINPFETQSRGQLASAMFRHHYLEKDVMQPHPNVRDYALRAYRGSGDYGGIWARGVFEAKPGHVWAEFDATSAYPAAAEMLGVLPLRHHWRPWAEGCEMLETGIYKAQVSWPTGQERRPLMALVEDAKAKGGERYAYPQFAVDIFSGFELAAAQRLGAQVRVIDGWYYTDGLDAFPVFQGHLRRLRARAERKDALALAALYKGLGNTIIGKLGQHKELPGYRLAWDEQKGAAMFTPAAKRYGTLGSMFAPEWWVLIVGRARAAMMEAIIQRQAVHAQVDSVLIEVPEDLVEFECGGLQFRRKGAGRVLRLAKRNLWMLHDHHGQSECPDGRPVRFAAAGGRDTPELRAAFAHWRGQALKIPWQDQRLVTLPLHASSGAPLMSPLVTRHVFKVPPLEIE